MTFKLGPIASLKDQRQYWSAADDGKCSKCRRSFQAGTLITLSDKGKFVHGAFCWR